MSNVTNISEHMPHISVRGLKSVHVLPLSVLHDVISRKISITDIEGWEDFLPEMMNDFLNYTDENRGK